MMKILKRAFLPLIFAMMMVCALVVAGCDNIDKPEPKPEATLVSISATSTKTEYVEGDSFDLTSLTVNAKYSDNSTKAITSGYTIDKTGALTVDDTKIIVTYQSKTAEIAITVTAKQDPPPEVTLESISATSTKTEYVEGDSFDLTSLTVTATYSDNSTQTVTSGYTIDKTGALTVDDTKITVTYEGKTAEIAITVTAKQDPPPEVTLESISATSTKTEYIAGESFDLTSLTVNATYSDNSTKAITSGYTIDKTGALTADDTKITVTYEGKTAEVAITVTVPATLESISASATKTEYYAGETFDLTSLTVTATYSDNSTQTVTAGYTIDKTEALTTDDTQITVSYEGKTATVNITVTVRISVTLSEQNDIANLQVIEDKPYYILKGTGAGALTAEMIVLENNSHAQPITCEKIVEEDEAILMYFDISSLTAGTYYPHLMVNGSSWDIYSTDNANGDVRNANLSESKKVTDIMITVGDNEYVITEWYRMPTISMSVNVPEDVSVTMLKSGCADLEVVEGKPYYVMYGTYTGPVKAELFTHYMERYQAKGASFAFVNLDNGTYRAYVDLSDMALGTLVLPHMYYAGVDAGTDGANVNDGGITCGKSIVCNGTRYTIYSKAAGGGPYYGMACVMAEDASKPAVMISLTSMSLELDEGLPYYTLEGSYTGDVTKDNISLYGDGNAVLPCEKIVLNEEDNTFKAYFALKDLTGGQLYPHLSVDGVKYANGVDGGNVCSTAEHCESVTPIEYGGYKYELVLSANMPTVKVTSIA